MIVNCAVYENGKRRGGDLALDDAGKASEFDLHELAVEDAR